MTKCYWMKDGKQNGPNTVSELKLLASNGVIRPTDKIRREDMDKWYPASKVQGLVFPASAPEPEILSLAPADDIDDIPKPVPRPVSSSKRNRSSRKKPLKGKTRRTPVKTSGGFGAFLSAISLLGFRICMVIIVLTLFLPWLSASSSSRYSSASMDISGISMMKGMCILVLAIAAVVCSVIAKKNTVPVLTKHGKIILVSVATLILIFVIAGFFGPSYSGRASAGGYSASASAGAGFGVFLAFLPSLVSLLLAAFVRFPAVDECDE